MSLANENFTAKNKQFMDAYNRTLDLLRTNSLTDEANKFEVSGKALIKEIINNERNSGPNNGENNSPELQKHTQATQQLQLLGITLSKYLETPDAPSVIKDIKKQTEYMQSLTEYVSAPRNKYVKVPLVEMPESLGANELPIKPGVLILGEQDKQPNWTSNVRIIKPLKPQDDIFKTQFEKETNRLLEEVNGLNGFLNTAKLFTENDAKKPLQDSIAKLRIAITDNKKAIMDFSAIDEESKKLLLKHQNMNASIINSMNNEIRGLNGNNITGFVHKNSQIMHSIATAMDSVADTLTSKQKRER